MRAACIFMLKFCHVIFWGSKVGSINFFCSFISRLGGSRSVWRPAWNAQWVFEIRGVIWSWTYDWPWWEPTSMGLPILCVSMSIVVLTGVSWRLVEYSWGTECDNPPCDDEEVWWSRGDITGDVFPKWTVGLEGIYVVWVLRPGDCEVWVDIGKYVLIGVGRYVGIWLGVDRTWCNVGGCSIEVCEPICWLFNASRDRGQVIHLFTEEAKQLLHPVTGLRETVRSV